MSPIRREVLNGLFVLVLSTLLSAGFAAFQVKFDVQLLVLILMAIAIAISGYVAFEFVLSSEKREMKTEERELEWLKRVGNPARLELDTTATGLGLSRMIEILKTMQPGTDLTIMLYVDPEGSRSQAILVTDTNRKHLYSLIMEQVKRGMIREYKRLICFDHDVLADDPELRSGILRVGEGPGSITPLVGEHCRAMLETKGCSLYVAPAILRSFVGLYGTDKASMTVETIDQKSGKRTIAGVLFFFDPPNAEIVEQFRQLVRETEKRMVAVHKVIFPEDINAEVKAATA